ncbi:RibD family protein [Microbacterium aureliae]
MAPTTDGGSSPSGAPADPDAGTWRHILAGDTTDDDDICALYGHLVRTEGRVAIGQLGQSLDGFIAARTGDACFVTGEEDRRHLHRLRALVDAVVIGWRTVRNDDPRLTVRAVAGRNPTRVILDPDARIPHASGVLTDGAAPTVWVVDAGTDVPLDLAGHVEVLPLPRVRELPPRELLDVLAARGLERVLVEGGGLTISRFVQARALDWLYLTTSPMLIGDGIPGIRFDGEDRLADALRGRVRRFTFGEDICTEFAFGPAQPPA